MSTDISFIAYTACFMNIIICDEGKKVDGELLTCDACIDIYLRHAQSQLNISLYIHDR